MKKRAPTTLGHRDRLHHSCPPIQGIETMLLLTPNEQQRFGAIFLNGLSAHSFLTKMGRGHGQCRHRKNKV
uniref:Uncharacterized protein n=1 Tax=Physcomitrium patens TaxID=3218 RepID=A0A2K1L1F2_PHYPA|nr:hypothetical protein PHYPA_002649 [Physcomitrium patens]